MRERESVYFWKPVLQSVMPRLTAAARRAVFVSPVSSAGSVMNFLERVSSVVSLSLSFFIALFLSRDFAPLIFEVVHFFVEEKLILGLILHSTARVKVVFFFFTFSSSSKIRPHYELLRFQERAWKLYTTHSWVTKYSAKTMSNYTCERFLYI